MKGLTTHYWVAHVCSRALYIRVTYPPAVRFTRYTYTGASIDFVLLYLFVKSIFEG